MAAFMTLLESSKTTGLSVYFLRKGCKNGTVPHIRNGSKYLVDMDSLLAQLRKESTRKEV